MAEELRTVGVVGCGLMGSGIAEVCARSGFETVVREVTPELLDRGKSRVERSLATAAERGKLSAEDHAATLGRLRFTTALADLAHCDLVIEAATEDPRVKKELFGELDGTCDPAAIFASNTSSIPIVELAAATARPDRVVGLHFFNPVPVMQLVEVISSIVTSTDTAATARSFAQRLSKRPILAKDRAGFIVNTLLIPYLLDAIRLVEQGFASAEDVDQGMRLGCGYPMGPLQLVDFIGADTTCSIAQIMYEEFKEPRYAPPPLLRQMVTAGRLGRKSGGGFYDYPRSAG